MKQVNIVSPCCLHLGFARANGQLCELGIALQHPQIQLVARPSSQLSVSGPRADVMLDAVEHLAHKHHLPLQGTIEIELAIPAHMGLGSDGMLRASAKHIMTIWHNIRTSFRVSLPEHAFTQGGVLLVNDEGLVQQRATIAHADDANEWVFVMIWPKEPDAIANDFEAQRLNELRRAAVNLSKLDTTDLFDAVARNDFVAFADSLEAIHLANEAALAASGYPITLSEQDNDILDFVRANGAVVSWRAITGLALIGLIKGADPSRALRKALTEKLGYFGPLVMASICDNAGARVITS